MNIDNKYQLVNRRRLHIWSDPESEISFLERVVGSEQAWEAVVHPAPGTNLHVLERKLLAEGYQTHHEFRPDTGDVLIIKHTGDSLDLIGNVDRLGLTKGLSRTIDGVTNSFDHWLGRGTDVLRYVMEDKARLLSGFYLVGDVALINAGRDNKGKTENGIAAAASHSHFGSPSKPENLLQTLTGIFATLQSLIFLWYAREGTEIQMDNLEKQFHKALESGQDPRDTRFWKTEKKHHAIPLWDAFDEFSRKHPIESGTLSQITGQVLYIISGGLRWHKSASALKSASAAEKFTLEEMISGSKLDLGRGVLSIIGWLTLMLPGHHQESGNEQKNEGGFLSKITSNPERVASVFETTASTTGLLSGLKKGNKSQWLGESLYIAGDMTLFFTKKTTYGQEGASAEDRAADAAAKFIEHAPMILGENERRAFVHDLACYVARGIVEENTPKKPEGMDTKTFYTARDEQVEAMGQRLARAIFKHLSGRVNALQKVAHHAAQVVELFPEAQHQAVIHSLSNAITHAPGVYIQAEELSARITEECKKINEMQPESPLQPPSMTVLSHSVSELVFAIPGIAAAHNASLLYDALAPHIRAGKQDIHLLDHAMNATAARQSNLTSAQANALRTMNPEHSAMQPQR